MAGIRSVDTRPELMIRKALHADGMRYRLHVRDLPGRPDIVFPARRAVIFVNGCFWHGHDCHLFRLPSTRTEFWRDKISRNAARDLKACALLREEGWRRLTVWECALRGQKGPGFEAVMTRIIRWLEGRRFTGEVRGRA